MTVGVHVRGLQALRVPSDVGPHESAHTVAKVINLPPTPQLLTAMLGRRCYARLALP